MYTNHIIIIYGHALPLALCGIHTYTPVANICMIIFDMLLNVYCTDVSSFYGEHRSVKVLNSEEPLNGYIILYTIGLSVGSVGLP